MISLLYQSETILGNVWFHLINPLIALPIIYLILFKVLKIERNSIEAKIMLLILLTLTILVEFIVFILMIIKGNYIFFFIMYISGSLILIYTLYYTIKTIKDFSQNLMYTQENLKKSEEKYRFAYNNVNLYKDIFAHDVSNIFQNFTLSFNLYENIVDTVKDQKSFNEMNDTIKYQLNRGVELVSNVQVLSEVEMLKPEFSPINLIKNLENLVSNIEIKFPDVEIEFILEPDEKIIVVEADDYISHIFKNLIFNGIYHNTNDLKTISINVSIEKLDIPHQIRIEINDNGTGLKFDHKKHLIDFFEDNVKSFTRSGLGLLVVKKLTSRYKGKILIEDRVEGDYTKGSKFIILIPVSY